MREGRDLLQADEHNVVNAPRAPCAAQVVVNLAAAQHHARDLGGRTEEWLARGVVRAVPSVVRLLAVVDDAVEEAPCVRRLTMEISQGNDLMRKPEARSW